jgi:pyruvate dehydrogenase E2 component (dihydrolipoamide acetyltransferase)
MHLIKLPRLGQTMESGTLTEWHIAEGEEFADGDHLYEVETEKMTTEVEAKQAGVLVRTLVPVDEEVDVGTVLAVAAEAGESPDDAEIEAFLQEQGLSQKHGLSEEAAGAGTAASENTDAALGGADAPGANAGAPGSAGSSAGSGSSAGTTPAAGTAAAAGSGPAEGERSDSAHGRTSSGRVLAFPRARAHALQHGLDLAAITGTGIDGAVRMSDVEDALRARGAGTATTTSAATASAGGPAGPPRVTERIELRGVEKSMAQAVMRSWNEIPQFVQHVSADATALRARLQRLRYEGVQVSYTDLLVSAAALTAAEVPEANASYDDGAVVRFAEVNVSVAMASDRGLLVPVVHDAAALSVAEVAQRRAELTSRAREGRLTAEDASHGTLTVSNLGAYGVDSGTPLVNAPQAVIVFAGALRDEVVAVDGRPQVQPRLSLSLAFDHRVLDGMTAARFTSALRDRIEAGG